MFKAMILLTRREDNVSQDIEIPDRKFKMTMSFRRNTDSSLPASHTAELTFILPQDFSGGGGVQLEFHGDRCPEDRLADDFQVAAKLVANSIQRELVTGGDPHRAAVDLQAHPGTEPNVKPIPADSFGKGGSQRQHDFLIVVVHGPDASFAHAAVTVARLKAHLRVNKTRTLRNSSSRVPGYR